MFKSWIGGYFNCSNNSKDNHPSLHLNWPFHVECKVLRHKVISAAEVETAGLFYNCQRVLYLQRMLHAIGHTQHNTSVKTENGRAAHLVSKMTITRNITVLYIIKMWDRNRLCNVFSSQLYFRIFKFPFKLFLFTLVVDARVYWWTNWSGLCKNVLLTKNDWQTDTQNSLNLWIDIILIAS